MRRKARCEKCGRWISFYGTTDRLYRHKAWVQVWLRTWCDGAAGDERAEVRTLEEATP